MWTENLSNYKGNRLFIRSVVYRAAGVSLASVVSLTAQTLHAQASSEAARIEKLEREVELLRTEINSLKAKEAAYPPGDKTKTKVTDEGKEHVEKAWSKKRNHPFMCSSVGRN